MQEPIFNSSDLSEYSNYASIIGEVEGVPTYSHTYDDVKYYSMRVLVKRRKRNRVDIIHVFSPEKLAVKDVILDGGVRIMIEGYLVQSELRGIFDVSIVATNIELVNDDVEDDNVVCIGGSIDKLFDLKQIKDTPRVVKHLVLRHIQPNDQNSTQRILSVKVSNWNNTAKLIESSYHKGDKIVVRGLIESREVRPKQEPGDTRVNDPILIHQINSSLIMPIK